MSDEKPKAPSLIDAVTGVRPREELPPISLELQEALKEAAQWRVTLVPCPACVNCPYCHDPESKSSVHMVTPERAAAYEDER